MKCRRQPSRTCFCRGTETRPCKHMDGVHRGVAAEGSAASNDADQGVALAPSGKEEVSPEPCPARSPTPSSAITTCLYLPPNRVTSRSS
jgi:hypothetical protein